jgi:hypothetical protein
MAMSFIISLLMSPLLGNRSSLWITHKENGPTHHAGLARVGWLAMGLLPVMSVVFLVASNFGKIWVPRRNIGDGSVTSSIKSEWCVCM